jgi:hypothetical protein
MSNTMQSGIEVPAVELKDLVTGAPPDLLPTGFVTEKEFFTKYISLIKNVNAFKPETYWLVKKKDGTVVRRYESGKINKIEDHLEDVDILEVWIKGCNFLMNEQRLVKVENYKPIPVPFNEPVFAFPLPAYSRTRPIFFHRIRQHVLSGSMRKVGEDHFTIFGYQMTISGKNYKCLWQFNDYNREMRIYKESEEDNDAGNRGG